ncbi:alginate lyase family protein [Thetidibacter halocola]|uniref:Alginate lyase family protein n=1 Tax=Thetidibacter halocola TaxID=2827239 RepID=A0A8J8B767_9RHOB|nr:alginate lyase family protein [Thetidibacter halocola]MBS0123409.1 alginate lyase family protein [Thetidibacter halocola]
MRLAAMALLGTLSAPAWAQDCPAPVDPVLKLDFDSRYQADDPTRSTLDKQAEAEAVAALDPLDDFLRLQADRAEAMLKAEGDARRAHADCLIGHLAHWARADALADQRSETVRLTIGSRLAAAAVVARAAIPHTTDYQGLDLTRVWLGRRVEEQMTFWEGAPDGAAQGNLRAWAAMAAAATADMLNDPVMRGWAAWSTVYILCTADTEGALPQEMARGRLALHYQLHALAPISATALLLERQGLSVRDRCGGALERVARFALGDLETGAASAALSGETQSFFDGSDDKLQDFQLAWLEPYIALTADPLAESLAAPRRPLSFSKLGGNQTLLWAP